MLSVIMEKLLMQVSNLSKKIGENAILNNISFSIKEDSINAFLFPNNGGKTTLIKALSGILYADNVYRKRGVLGSRLGRSKAVWQCRQCSACSCCDPDSPTQVSGNLHTCLIQFFRSGDESAHQGKELRALPGRYDTCFAPDQ